MEWFENDWFWTELYPYMFSEERMDKAVSEVDKILGLTGMVSGHVLDLCCGPGRHSIEFSKRQFDVTGVDKTYFLLDKARKRAREFDMDVEWIESDIREFVRPSAFDLVINMFTAFGYFADKCQDLKVLENMAKSLKPGGKAIVDVMGKEIIARVFQSSGWERLDDGSVLVQHREIFDDWTRIRNEWVLIKPDGVKRFPFQHTLYSGQELRELFLHAGFSAVNLYGNLDGDEYGVEAERLVAVGIK